MESNKTKYKEVLMQAVTLEDVSKVLEYANMFHHTILLKDLTEISFYIINNIIIWEDKSINEDLAFQIDVNIFEKIFGFSVKVNYSKDNLEEAFFQGCEFIEKTKPLTVNEKEDGFNQWCNYPKNKDTSLLDDAFIKTHESAIGEYNNTPTCSNCKHFVELKGCPFPELTDEPFKNKCEFHTWKVRKVNS
jgi:hypothetical protein